MQTGYYTESIYNHLHNNNNIVLNNYYFLTYGDRESDSHNIEMQLLLFCMYLHVNTSLSQSTFTLIHSGMVSDPPPDRIVILAAHTRVTIFDKESLYTNSTELILIVISHAQWPNLLLIHWLVGVAVFNEDQWYMVSRCFSCEKYERWLAVWLLPKQ